jgi:hypothetical protein
MSFNNDVYGYKRNPKPTGVFSTDNSKLVFGSVTNPAGYLVQGWGITYAQDVQEVMELGSNDIYWVKGRPTGQGQLAKAIGRKAGAKFFPDDAYDLCAGGATVNLIARGGACEGQELEEVRLVLSGLVVTNLGFTQSVQDLRVNQSIQFRFSYMALGN